MQPHRENEDEDEQRNDRESGGRMPTLDWRNRDEATRAAAGTPLHILREVPELGVGGASENLLVHGDNLAALKALLPFAAGLVKCIYIDPPYNTGSAFEHYDDNLEHSTWLSLLYPRLQLLREFLSEDGSIWISIDEKECHYLKVICDEIFGRQNFVIQTTIKRGAATGHKAINQTPVQVSDYMLTYAKDKSKWVYHPVYAKRDYDKAYNKFIVNYDSSYEDWTFCSLKDEMRRRKCTIEDLLKTEAHRIVRTAQPSYDAVGEDTRRLINLSKSDPTKIYLQKREGYSDIYLKNGERILFYKDKLRCIDGEWVTAELVTNIWTDMNYQGIANEGTVKFLKSKKPEAQIARVFQMATSPGDLVLDSFLGSGTTAAVAHKMGRRWIGVEMGEHARTHCAVRLRKVIEGEQGGISKAVGWKGGGSFRFLELGEELLDGNGAIRESIPWEVLAAHVWWKETKTGWMNVANVASYSSHLPMTPQGPLENGNIGTGNTSTVATLKRSPVLGVKDGVAYALLYNGILKDRRVDGGNVLTKRTLALIRDDLGSASFDSLVVYAEWSKLGAEALAAERIVLKQTPYDLNDRK